MTETTINILELKISEYANVGRVEKEIYHFLEDKDYSLAFLLDLSDVTYIQTPTTLVYLAQFIYKRDLKNLRTYLRLPISNKVISILYTWRFFEIIEELTGKQISYFIEGEIDRFPKTKFEIGGKKFYLDINQDYFDKYYKEDQVKKLVKKGFFSLICEPFKEENQKELTLKKQRRTWSTEKLMTDVLQQNLLENVPIGNLLPNTIIFECLTNAINHPNSDHLVIGSFYDFSNNEDTKKGNKDKFDYFTIVIWDDGDSIIKTLSDSIKSGVSIRSKEYFELAQKTGYRTWFRIIRKDYSKETKNEYFFYDYLPNKKTLDDDLDDEILISSFLPGVSRLPSISKKKINTNESNNQIKENSEEIVDTSSGTGMGLTYLLKAVTKDLNGSIHVRTDNYLLEITRAREGGGIEYNDMLFYKRINEKQKKDVDFFCKSELRYYSLRGGLFIGNMLTIKIPLKKRIP